MRKDPTEFRKRFLRWKAGEKVYEAGKISDLQYYDIMERVAELNNAEWNKDRRSEGSPELSVDEEFTRILNDNTYDYRGYYNKYPRGKGNAIDHWTDEFKTVYHPTFSVYSKYSGKKSLYNPEGVLGGRWDGERYVPAWGQKLPKYGDGKGNNMNYEYRGTVYEAGLPKFADGTEGRSYGYLTEDKHPIKFDEQGNLVDLITGDIGTMRLPEVQVSANPKELAIKNELNNVFTLSNDATSVANGRPQNRHLERRAVEGAKAHAAWDKEHPNLTAWGNVLGAVPFAVATYPLAAIAGSGITALGDAAAATSVGQGITNFLSPIATTSVAGATAPQLFDMGLTSIFGGHGVKTAIDEGGISPMTALELLPVTRVVKPAVEMGLQGIENVRYPLGRINEGAISKTFPTESNFNFWHGGLEPDFNFADLDVLRLASKQAKKGRDYAGFYMYDSSNQPGAFGYGMGEAHGIKIADNAKVFNANFNTERLPVNKLINYQNQGYDLIKGQNVFGEPEYILLNKDAIESSKFFDSNPGHTIHLRKRQLRKPKDKSSTIDWNDAKNAQTAIDEGGVSLTTAPEIAPLRRVVKPISTGVKNALRITDNVLADTGTDFSFKGGPGLDLFTQKLYNMKIHGQDLKDFSGKTFSSDVKKGVSNKTKEEIMNDVVGRNMREFINDGLTSSEVAPYATKVKKLMDNINVGRYTQIDYEKAGWDGFGGFYDPDRNFLSINEEAAAKGLPVEPHEVRHAIDHKIDDEILMPTSEIFGKDFDSDRVISSMRRTKQKQNMILQDAYDSDFIDIPNKSGYNEGLENYHSMEREAITTNRDAREALLGNKKDWDFNFTDKIIDKMPDNAIFEAVEKANGYGRRYIRFLRDNNKLTPKKAKQFREAMKHVGGYAIPTAIAAGTLYGTNQKRLKKR